MAAKRKDVQNYEPQYLPNQQPNSPRVVRRVVTSKPKRSFYTLKMLLVMGGLGLFGLMFAGLYMDSQINHVHYQTQQVRRLIAEESAMNEQLVARISELSRHSRIIDIATLRGLEFNENIINIRASSN